MSTQKFYVTTPIYYVTAAPHLGSLYSTLLADVAAKYHALQGKETYFVTGTDEHGQKIAEAAQKAGKKPQDFVDGFVDSYKDMWKLYGIEYNHFIRTTDTYHVQAVQQWLKQLLASGDIYKDSYKGWYCVPCESFVTQDMHEQNPECPDCNRATKYLEEESYFFKLSAYQEQLLQFYQDNPDFITPKERLQEVISFVKSGLKDLSISRTTISWGIPFPGDTKHVAYVWADALLNYITAIGFNQHGCQQKLQKWWPADLQILGKDIVRFHAVYWPAFLMATGLQMPKKLLVHGWIKVADQKMSKSKGNVVDPGVLAEQYGVDVIRYYLTRKMALTQDSQFKHEDIVQSNNSELANDLGNLLQRTISLALRADCAEIICSNMDSVESQKLQTHAHETVRNVEQLVEQGMLYRAVNIIWELINKTNAYFHEMQPWKQRKDNKEAFIETIAATLHSLQTAAILLWPVMPQKMQILCAALGKRIQINTNYYTLLQQPWSETFMLTKPDKPLFEKQEQSEETAEQKNNKSEQNLDSSYIDITDFIKVDMRAGTIIQADAVEGSDKLLKLQVDFGDLGIKQILSGIKKSYRPENLQGKQGVFVINLKPRKMMGMLSEGMMLFAGDKKSLSMLQPDALVQPGVKIG